MKKSFVDTNLFIRYLTNDDPVKADRVEKLLNQAAGGSFMLVTTELVIAEIVWVLESYYELTNVAIAPLVRGILATPVEKIAASLRLKSNSRQKRTTGWDDLYGIAKGIWAEDAQEYVNRQREERT